jgi:pilus assembly protein CpaB
LGYIPFPKDDVIEGMYTDVEEAAGYRARFDLEPQVPLVSGMVVEDISELSETGSDHALLIPPGMVAVSIPISRFSSVAYGLDRGDHVNVIATMLFVDLDSNFQTPLPNYTAAVIGPGPNVVINGALSYGDPLLANFPENLTAQIASGGALGIQGRAEFDQVLQQPFYLVPSQPTQRPRMVSQSLLQDIVVLHVGNFPRPWEKEIEEEPEPVAEETPEGEEPVEAPPPPPPPPPPDIITLIVSPQDAVTLNYMAYSGAQLNLALRASGDDSRIFTDAVTLQYLLDQYNIPVPAKQSYGLEPSRENLGQPLFGSWPAPPPPE